MSSNNRDPRKRLVQVPICASQPLSTFECLTPGRNGGNVGEDFVIADPLIAPGDPGYVEEFPSLLSAPANGIKRDKKPKSPVDEQSVPREKVASSFQPRFAPDTPVKVEPPKQLKSVEPTPHVSVPSDGIFADDDEFPSLLSAATKGTKRDKRLTVPQPPPPVEQPILTQKVSSSARPNGAPETTVKVEPPKRPPETVATTPDASVATGKFADVAIMRRPLGKNGQPLFCKIGRRVNVVVNHFNLNLSNEEVTIFHYDVSVSPICAKAKKMAIMDAARIKYPDAFGCKYFGYDGNANLYTTENLDAFVAKQMTIEDADCEGQLKPRIYLVTINKRAAQLQLSDLKRFLAGTTTDHDVWPVVAALDTAVLTSLRIQFETAQRFFYPTPDPTDKFPLSDFSEAREGFFSAIKPGQGKLTLNCDITVTAILKEGPLIDLFKSYRGTFEQKVRQMNELLRGTKIRVEFGKPVNPADRFKYKYKKTILKFLSDTAATFKFIDDEGRRWTVADYFLATHQVRLEHPDEFPVVHVAPKGKKIFVYPMECCRLLDNQRSSSTLQIEEQGQLVRRAAMPPAKRLAKTKSAINHHILSKEQQIVMEQFGIKVIGGALQPLIVSAQVLPQVNIEVGNSRVLPGDETAGFKLRGSQFSNPANLGKWGYATGSNRCNQSLAEAWVKQFQTFAIGKGMRCNSLPENFTPNRPMMTRNDVEAVMDKANRNGFTFLLFFIDEGSDFYSVIKQLGDRRYKIVTQCVVAANFGKKKEPNKIDWVVIDNVLLKVNAKLGGTNHKVSNSAFTSLKMPPLFDEDVLLIGADVTHPKPGDETSASIAAIVGSIDRHATVYKSFVVAQTHRQEWIDDFDRAVQALLMAYFCNTNKRKPKRIIVFRDGVSEGQYMTVLQAELYKVQRAVKTIQLKDPSYNPMVTYLVARKRINTKMYPADDKDAVGISRNVAPGTLVDVDITQPLQYFDWYLVPHYSLQGTARPSQYVVLYDESHFDPDTVAMLTFVLCHLFPRCTRAVSLPAPVYHAHLAAERATYHRLYGIRESGSVSSEESKDKAALNAARIKAITLAKELIEIDETVKPNYWI